MDAFALESYREIIQREIKNRPRQGYGQLTKLARALSVNTTFISQVMSGAKNFNLEQAVAAARFLQLNQAETDYFVLLVQKERAGSVALVDLIERQLQDLRRKNSQVISKISKSKKLTDKESSVFYSDWVFSAVRQLCAIKSYQSSPEAMAERLKISVLQVNTALQFLKETGLVIDHGDHFTVGPSRTHLPPSSPWIKALHTNWRLQAIEKVKERESGQVHYTCPLTLKISDIEKVKSKILELIKEVGEIVDKSESEELCCINIDWFCV